jgi:hypothetical protein
LEGRMETVEFRLPAELADRRTGSRVAPHEVEKVAK